MYQIGSELSVPQPFHEHVGVYIGNGLVFHNHPERGEELVSLDVFASGRKISIKKVGVDNVAAFFQRLYKAIASPTSYQLFTNNCEHTVSRLRTGVAKSPQAWFWGTLGVLATAGGILVLRSKR